MSAKVIEAIRGLERDRFRAITDVASATPDEGAIRTGFASLRRNDNASKLIARADSQLIRNATNGRFRP